jgi:hypothetical protein
MNFSFSVGDFDVEHLVNEQISEVVREYEQSLNQLGTDLKGRPIEDVKPLVRARLQDLGVNITDPELTDIATAVSEGGEITLNIQVED